MNDRKTGKGIQIYAAELSRIESLHLKYTMKAGNSQYCGDQYCAEHKGSLQPWIVKEPFCKDNRMIRLTVKSMEQACQAKCSESIRTAKQCAVLVISCQKCDHCHRTDHKALQTDFAEDNWWNKDFKNIFRPEEGREIARPRMIFLSECENVSLAGFTVRNSPAWNIHPILCEHVDALCLSIEGPKNSHNTDGFDPESCGFVRILGCQFSVGDDCIAIKSGKLGIEPELRPATHDVLISHCYMHDGHGAVVLGSEAAGGIKDLTVSKCLFERTDRGLRVKTRRGRGKDAVNEGITFEHIRMDKVLTPFVVNPFYFCDKDGKTDYVQSREALPVDDRTPGFGATTFCDIEATNCHAAAAYITGLPESKVTRLTFQDVHVTFAADAEPFVPAMACGVEPMVRQGIIAQNVKVLDLQNVRIEGQDGDELQLQNVDKVIRA